MKSSFKFSPALIKELERREALLLSGKTKLHDWEDVKEKIRKKIMKMKEQSLKQKLK